MIKIFVIITAIFLIFLLPACAPAQAPEEDAPAGEYENDFTLLNLDGEEVSLSDYQGNIVVINFWATWCPPCREEIPDFIQVYDEYRDQGVQFLGVSNEDRDTLASFADEFGINYPVLIDGSVDTIFPEWGIRAIPTTFIVGENGEILSSFEGYMPKEVLENEINQWL